MQAGHEWWPRTFRREPFAFPERSLGPISPPTLSIVITTYNRRDLLVDMLTPLMADPGTEEVVVVVDGSTDGSYELLQDTAERDPRLKPVLISNSGKEAARETGILAATGDLVLLLDDDVVAEAGLAAGHVRLHAEAEDLVVVGYMPVPVADRRSAASVLYAREYEGVVTRYEREPELVLEKLWGGNVSLRREAALAVGLRSPSFGAGYHQDRDFGLRCREAGLRGRFDRSLRAAHRHRRTTPAFVRDATQQGRALRQLHAVHSASLGGLPEDAFTAGLPRPLASLTRATRRPRLGAATLAALTLVARTLERLGLITAAVGVLRLLRRIAQQRGATSPSTAS